MKLYFLFYFINHAFCELNLFGQFKGCSRGIASYNYHKSLQEFSTRLLKKVAEKNNYNFAVSQYSIWLAMSAMVEGAREDLKPSLFKALNLPKDICERDQYYEIATELEDPSSDVTLSRNRLLLLDGNLKVNLTWTISVRESGLVNPLILPLFNFFPNITKRTILDLVPKKINHSSNSVLIDVLDYKGLWTTGFCEDCIEKGDFFDDAGNKIGQVEFMKVKQKVKLAIIPFLNAKLLELEVGNKGRYRMIFIINTGRTSIKQTIAKFPPTYILDILPYLMESIIPLELAIPRFNMTSYLDLKETLSEMGLGAVFKNGTNTQISDPPAIPHTLFQDVSISITSSGLNPPLSCGSAFSIATDIASFTGKDFIANRPFIYGLVDSKTRTWLFSGVFSNPK